jgi:hypothetical protein
MTGLLVHLAHKREKLCLIRQCLLDHFRRSDPVGVAAPSIGLRSSRIEARNMHIEIVSSLFRILGSI